MARPRNAHRDRARGRREFLFFKIKPRVLMYIKVKRYQSRSKVSRKHACWMKIMSGLKCPIDGQDQKIYPIENHFFKIWPIEIPSHFDGATWLRGHRELLRKSRSPFSSPTQWVQRRKRKERKKEAGREENKTLCTTEIESGEARRPEVRGQRSELSPPPGPIPLLSRLCDRANGSCASSTHISAWKV